MPTEPQPLDEFPWTFVADAPAGRRHVIALEPTGSTGNAWRGTFAFDEAGRWEIGLDRSHLGTPVDPSLGAREAVIVRDAGGGVTPVILMGLGLVAVVIGFLVRARLGRSSRRGATDKVGRPVRR